MSHACTWRSKTAWREDARQSEGWQTSQRVRLRLCIECGQEQDATPAGRRRRQRTAILPDQTEPPTLRPAVPIRQWDSVATILSKLPGNRLEVEQQLHDWLADGWIEVEEEQEKYGQNWRIVKARLSEAARERLITQPAAAQGEKVAALKTELLAVLAGWEADVTQARSLWAGDSARLAVLDHIAAILPEQIAALQQGQWPPLPRTSQQAGGPVHQRWLRLLRGLAALLASEETVYERAFAAQWLGDSKAFTQERRPLAAYLGIEWEQLGLYRHTPVVLCWGDFAAQYEEYEVDGRAGAPFIALSAETVRGLTAVRVNARAVLIVENQTAFEALLQTNLRQENLLYLFGGGHAGYAERQLLKLWLATRAELPWYVWTDWDVGGVRIQMDWAQLAERYGLSRPQAWLWTDERLAKWGGLGRPLAAETSQALQALNHPLAAKLVRAGYTLEQEAIVGTLSREDLAML